MRGRGSFAADNARIVIAFFILLPPFFKFALRAITIFDCTSVSRVCLVSSRCNSLNSRCTSDKLSSMAAFLSCVSSILSPSAAFLRCSSPICRACPTSFATTGAGNAPPPPMTSLSVVCTPSTVFISAFEGRGRPTSRMTCCPGASASNKACATFTASVVGKELIASTKSPSWRPLAAARPSGVQEST